MSSALKFNEAEGNPLGDLIQMLLGRANMAEYAANQPLEAALGTKWQYSSGTTNPLLKHRLKAGDVYQTKLQLAQSIIAELVTFGFNTLASAGRQFLW